MTTGSGWPRYSEEEIRLASEILRSGRVNYLTGPHGRAFEAEFADRCGTRHAVSLANGSLGLEATLRALGIGAGDEVVVPARTFVSTGSGVVLAGARPVFADVDEHDQTVTRGTVEDVLTDRVRAIVAVHLAGQPCDMDPLLDLARERGIAVIEDCAQAHGATYRGRPVGSMGTAGIYSFCQDKIISTAGEGGMLVTNDESLRRDVCALRDHGRVRAAAGDAESRSRFQWLSDAAGSNLRLTEIQSAIGRVQLGKLEDWIVARTHNAAFLAKAWSGHGALRIPWPGETVRHAFYRMYVFVRPEALRPDWNRDRMLREIRAAGVPGSVGSCPEIYLERAFRDRGLGPRERLPVARRLGETSLAFLVHPTLEERELRATADVVSGVVARATGS